MVAVARWNAAVATEPGTDNFRRKRDDPPRLSSDDIRRDMDRRVSKFASGKMSILSIKFAVSSRGFPDPCNQFPVLLRREFNSKPLNFLIDWTSKSPKEA
jgi:hypothetical protein